MPPHERAPHERDALITGIGLVSCLGEGIDAHWAALDARWRLPAGRRHRPVSPRSSVHPMAPLELDRQIPKRGDQRQMEPWQRIGVYAAGLALEAAGVKGDAALLGAHGHDRRRRRRRARLRGGQPRSCRPAAAARPRRLPERAPAVRPAARRCSWRSCPTCWPATSRSCTAWSARRAPSWARKPAGTDAVRIACARIAGRPGRPVPGRRLDTTRERPDVLLHYAMGGVLTAGRPTRRVWQRQATAAGMVLGSLGCFLVIESRAHAAARGATPLARIAGVAHRPQPPRSPARRRANADAPARRRSRRWPRTAWR